MNRLAILYLLTIFCVSFAFPEDVRDKVYKPKEVRIDTRYGNRPTRTFNDGDVYLYKIIEQLSHILQEYVVGDDSGEFSDHFAICQCYTIVTEDKVLIKWHGQLITVIVDGSPFAFYRKFFPLDDFSDQFFVKRVFQGRKLLENVSVIKAKKADYSHWFFVALQDDTPHFLFPTGLLELLSKKKDTIVDEVSFTVQTKPETVISIEFNDSSDAIAFYEFLSQRSFSSN